MNSTELLSALECVLFVSGEPILIDELCRIFDITMLEMTALLSHACKLYEEQKRGIVLHITDESVQLVSNKKYSYYVEEFLQPTQTRTFSQALLETLTIVAYRQPITRAEIDFIRGVRSEYSISQLLKQGFIKECGRKEIIGRPQLLGTTDKFLRKFGLHSLADLPNYDSLSDPNRLTLPDDDDKEIIESV